MVKPKIFWLVVALFALAVLGSVFGWARVGLDDWEAWGQFGDKFGALNTLFTGLAFVGVVAALWHERDSANDREREHKEILEAMKAQAEAAKTASIIQAQVVMIRSYQQEIDMLAGLIVPGDDALAQRMQELRDKQNVILRWLERHAGTDLS